MYHGAVLEVLIVLALLVALAGSVVVPWTLLLAAGVWTTAAGLVLGVPTGLWYHIALGRVLSAARALVPRWWLRPVSLHARLDEAGRRRVLPWFYAGAVGFMVTVVGLALVGLALLAVGVWRRS